MIDIIAEYLRAMRATPFKAAEQLHTQFGIPWISVRATCPVPMKVTFADKAQRFYQPDSDGFPVWVLPVTCVDPEQSEEIEVSDPLKVISCGRVVDLLGFDPERPRRFVRRTGLAPVLGCVPPQYCDPDRVPVWRDVTDWLRAGCVGLVLLTDDPFERGRILRRIGAVLVEDPEHAAQLKAWLELPAYPRALTTAISAMGSAE